VRCAATRWGLFAAALTSAVLFLGCGGGASTFNPPPPPPVALAITTTILPKAVTGTAYSTKLQATGGTPPYTWALALFPGQTAASVLPAGLAFASDGTISGTAAPGCYISWAPQITVQDSAGQIAGVGLELDCVAPLTFSSNLLPDGNIAIPYSALFSIQGGYPPIQFALTSGSLPPGVTLDKTQALQGTPSAPGKYTFTIQASDTKTPTLTASQSFNLTIQNNLVFTGNNLPQGIVNFSYSQPVPVAGGTLPYHFSILPQSVLPAGLSLDGNSGLISGTPSATGYSTFWVQVVDSSPQPATISQYLTLAINLPVAISTTNLPDSALGSGYSANLSVINGVPPYTATLTSGALPDGLSITGLNVTGSSAKDGLFKFTVKVSDAYSPPSTATKDYQIRISDPMTLSGPSQTAILYNQSYSTNFPATGGFPPYTWGMNPIPPGFTFDPTTGTLNGSPNGPSFTNTNVSVHDSSNPPLSATYYGFSLDVTPKLVIYTTSLPPVATASTVLIQPLTNGGAAPYQWSVSPGSLPPGMNLSSFSNGNVYISGSPATAGVYTFTLNISDGNTGSLHQTTSQQLTWTVKDPGQMTRNDTILNATPVSNLILLASISPYSDPSTAGPDVDVYSASAPPGSIVQVYAAPNNDFMQPPEPNSLEPVLEIVDSNAVRYQTCGGSPYNLPCINHLLGTSYIQGNYYNFQVPGTGTAPVTFFMRVSDARGDARPDFIYTFTVSGVN
jgi:large repetitive protein